MALSNQSELPAFFSPWQVNLKISHHILLTQKFWKMTCQDWPNPRRLLTENGQITDADFSRMAKSWKMTDRDCRNPSLQQDGIGQGPEHQLP
jgi:hypothetical protein